MIRKRNQPMTRSLPAVSKGSQPTDGGNLIVSVAEYEDVMSDPIAAKYVRPFVGADELIKGRDRWCLWLVDATPADIESSPVLRGRVENVREMRQASKKAATQTQASVPHLFTEIRQPHVPYLCIPSHFTENRTYATVQRFSADVIASNANFTALDNDGFLFALISSSLFMEWQQMVGGRIKSDYRFSNTIVWNNFPLGKADPAECDSIIAAGSAVLLARANYPGVPLEDLYNRNTMPKDLLDAHLVLDYKVDSFFGIPSGALPLDRQKLLLQRYSRFATNGKS